MLAARGRAMDPTAVSWLLLLVAALATPGRAADEEGPELSAAVALVTNSSNALVPGLFQYLAERKENFLVAPFGVAVNLGMVLEGARGQAADEIRAALGVGRENVSASVETLRQGFRAVLSRFQSTADHEDVSGAFTSATLHSARRLPDQYRTLLEDYYLATLSTAPESDVELNATAVALGNETEMQVLWLSSDTGVMSHWRDFHLLPVYVLLSHQAAAPFTRGPGDILTAPMVPLVGVFRFGKSNVKGAECFIVEIPLEARGTSLVLLLPERAGDDSLQPLAGLAPRVPRMLLKLPPTEMEVLLPQLAAVSRSKDLRPALRAMGINAVLDRGHRQYVANLTQDAFVSTSFVAINSVSSVGSRLAERSRRQATPRLVLNRPFVFYVLHDGELILLAGKVHTPAQVPSGNP